MTKTLPVSFTTLVDNSFNGGTLDIRATLAAEGVQSIYDTVLQQATRHAQTDTVLRQALGTAQGKQEGEPFTTLEIADYCATAINKSFRSSIAEYLYTAAAKYLDLPVFETPIIKLPELQAGKPAVVTLCCFIAPFTDLALLKTLSLTRTKTPSDTKLQEQLTKQKLELSLDNMRRLFLQEDEHRIITLAVQQMRQQLKFIVPDILVRRRFAIQRMRFLGTAAMLGKIDKNNAAESVDDTEQAFDKQKEQIAEHVKTAMIIAGLTHASHLSMPIEEVTQWLEKNNPKGLAKNSSNRVWLEGWRGRLLQSKLVDALCAL